MFRRSHPVFITSLVVALLASLLVPAITGLAPLYAAGSAGLTTLGSTYTENFDTLASTGTANTTVPNGWDFSESGTNANTTYRAGTGSDATGDTYSFGAIANTERAFGGLRSGSLVPLIGVQFANNTGGTITSLAIAYTGEQWRLGQNTAGRSADRLDFQISTNATSLATGTWTDYDSLDFSSPAVAGTVGPLNGNAAPNRTALSFTITSLSIPNGASFWVRWADTDLIPGSDDGLSVDDFSLTPNGIPDSETAPSVSSTTPTNGAVDVPVNSNLTVVFSEPVNVVGDWFSLNCVSGGLKSATVSGGPTTFTLDPDSDFAFGDSCTLTVVAAQVTDQDTFDPPDAMATNVAVNFTTAVDVCTFTFTPIYQIQGSGLSAAITGTVTTQGVVVGDYEGPSPTLRGFYLQDMAGDANGATSDGTFVFNGSNNSVSLGDVVRVSGTAAEFQDQTQITASSISPCGTGSVTPVDVTFPVPSPTFLEQYEGMLVRLPQTMLVTEHFQLGRFGQVVLSAGARLAQPTNVVAPGAPAIALQAQNDLNRIILDDASQVQNPDPIVFARGGLPLSASNTLRGGDTATGIVGVMSYTWAGNAASGNAYRVRPINALGGSVAFAPSNPRPTAAPAVSGRLRVTGMNLLNFFNTFDGLPDVVDNCTNGVGGAATDCRGADNAAEFARQWPKTVAAVLGTGADVVGLVEIENDGYGSDSALQFLVNSLNAATAPNTYAFIDVDAATGQVNALGTDAIKVGLIYKPAVVTPVGQTAALNSVEFVNGGDSAARDRPAIAQAFQENSTGARFVVSVNHLKSKGSLCDAPDTGDGQGNCNLVRTNAANLLAAWLASDPTGSGDSDVLITGDLNSYAVEDPIIALQSAGYANLIAAFNGPAAYSYVFDGQWGYLDHALGSGSLVPQLTGVADWHINSDEPSVLDYNTDFKTANLVATLYAPDEFRIADHDPVLTDMALTDLPPAASLTGGGWFQSGAGNFAPNPAVTGKLHINADLYDASGPGGPVGEVKVRFLAAGMDFRSTSFEWLVVSGSRAEVRGSGTINGGGSYGFLLTVVDGANAGGKPDAVRIQIWNRDAGNAMIYDSQPGTIQAAVPSVRLDGGNLTILSGMFASADATAAPASATSGPAIFLPLVENR